MKKKIKEWAIVYLVFTWIAFAGFFGLPVSDIDVTYRILGLVLLMLSWPFIMSLMEKLKP